MWCSFVFVFVELTIWPDPTEHLDICITFCRNQKCRTFSKLALVDLELLERNDNTQPRASLEACATNVSGPPIQQSTTAEPLSQSLAEEDLTGRPRVRTPQGCSSPSPWPSSKWVWLTGWLEPWAATDVPERDRQANALGYLPEKTTQTWV